MIRKGDMGWALLIGHRQHASEQVCFSTARLEIPSSQKLTINNCRLFEKNINTAAAENAADPGKGAYSLAQIWDHHPNAHPGIPAGCYISLSPSESQHDATGGFFSFWLKGSKLVSSLGHPGNDKSSQSRNRNSRQVRASGSSNGWVGYHGQFPDIST